MTSVAEAGVPGLGVDLPLGDPRSQETMAKKSAPIETPPMSPEAVALKEAESVAQRRVRFFGHVVLWLLCFVFLSFAADCESAMVVALLWGIFLGHGGYKTIVAPQLQRQFTEQEFRWRMQQLAGADRKAMESKHARSLETLSASIAHEIRNPITAAKSLVQQMGEDPSSAENVEYARIAIEELDRVERSISHLLRYAREEALELVEVDMRDVVDSAVETFRDRLAKTGIRVDREVDDSCRLKGDPEKLRRVVINLIGNAVDVLEAAAVPDPAVKVSAGQNLAGSEIWMRVEDNGPGIPKERAEKLFTPFFTSKANGTGLGLAITRKLVEAHHGRIEVSSVEGQGSKFEVILPKEARA